MDSKSGLPHKDRDILMRFNIQKQGYRIIRQRSLISNQINGGQTKKQSPKARCSIGRQILRGSGVEAELIVSLATIDR